MDSEPKMTKKGEATQAKGPKKPYKKPHITKYGRVVKLTLKSGPNADSPSGFKSLG